MVPPSRDVVKQKNWPCSRSTIPFASIVGCLGALDHASRRNTASSAGNRWPQGQPMDGTPQARPFGAALLPGTYQGRRWATVALHGNQHPAQRTWTCQAGESGSRGYSRRHGSCQSGSVRTSRGRQPSMSDSNRPSSGIVADSKGAGAFGVVLVAHECKVEEAGVDRGVHAFDLPATVYRAQTLHAAVEPKRAYHRATDAAVKSASAEAVKTSSLVGDRRGVTERQVHAIDVAEVVLAHVFELLGVEAQVVSQRMQQRPERQIHHEVGSFLLRAAMKQPKTLAHRRGALNIQLGNVLAQKPVERRKGELIRLARDRAVRGEPADEALARARAWSRNRDRAAPHRSGPRRAATP